MTYASKLRCELAERAMAYARRNGIEFYKSLGDVPTIMFTGHSGGRLHGNFLSRSYSAILADDAWRERLEKPHQRPKALPHARRSGAKELDSSNSSDALLMNVFCYPGLVSSIAVAQLFGSARLSKPVFGFRAVVPFANGETDRTEIDMRLGDILLEAKLTEVDFTKKSKSHVAAYRDFAQAFDTDLLPQTKETYSHYQLIRNVLAAYDRGLDFFLVCDARRPDLIESWGKAVSSIRIRVLRARCHLLLWQEIAAAAPDEVCVFLEDKYGVGSR